MEYDTFVYLEPYRIFFARNTKLSIALKKSNRCGRRIVLMFCFEDARVLVVAEVVVIGIQRCAGQTFVTYLGHLEEKAT